MLQASICRPFLVTHPVCRFFQAGQYIAVLIPVGNNEIATRTYSLSCSSAINDYFRISVKREPLSLVPSFLDEVCEVDMLTCLELAGDFVYNHSNATPVVFWSAGVVWHLFYACGTKILWMVWNLRQGEGYWVHLARDGNHYPFQDEVQRLAHHAGCMLNVHIAYTQPLEVNTLTMLNRVVLISTCLADCSPICVQRNFRFAGHKLLQLGWKPASP